MSLPTSFSSCFRLRLMATRRFSRLFLVLRRACLCLIFPTTFDYKFCKLIWHVSVGLLIGIWVISYIIKQIVFLALSRAILPVFFFDVVEQPNAVNVWALRLLVWIFASGLGQSVNRSKALFMEPSELVTAKMMLTFAGVASNVSLVLTDSSGICVCDLS